MVYDQSEAREFHDQASVLLYNAGLLLKAGVHSPIFAVQGFNIAWSQLAAYFENDAMSMEFRHAVVGLVMAALHEVEQARGLGTSVGMTPGERESAAGLGGNPSSDVREGPGSAPAP